MEVKDSPVSDELNRQIATGAEFIDATKLWQASGRKRNKSPRAWLCKDKIISDPGGSPDVEILIGQDTALIYAQNLCDKLLVACGEVFMRAMREDPTRHMMNCPPEIADLVGIFAVGAVMDNTGLGPDEAAAQLLAESVTRASALDVYAEETAVANAQRGTRLATKAIVRTPKAE